MRVEVWVRATLVKSPNNESDSAYLRIAQWDDPDSKHSREAAARVWRVCSSGAMDLTPMERQWQQQWRANRQGYGFGVGDVVVAGDAAYRCDVGGFSPTERPR